MYYMIFTFNNDYLVLNRIESEFVSEMISYEIAFRYKFFDLNLNIVYNQDVTTKEYMAQVLKT